MGYGSRIAATVAQATDVAQVHSLAWELPYAEGTAEKGKNKAQKDTCIPTFTAVLFTIAKTQKQPKCPSKEGHTHTHTLLSYEKA